jgi:xylulose-5-phosphate/fructose-6-phosphate phosphoketolase
MATLDPERARQLHRYWCAANYLTVGQIYLRENPLLREPLRPEHIKPRLLGHWGTSPGLSFIYAHLNRLITDTDANVIYLTGPGHGGPAIVANVYLEGTYSEIYPEVSMDAAGLRRLFRQFSSPGGIPSHVSVPTPGSIHEGGELGYVLAHAFGAVFDNPDLIAIAVVGDGEAETGPLEGAWKSVKFIEPSRDGAVLPILHLNGYKISGPTVLGRDDDGDVRKLLEAHGYDVTFVEEPRSDAAVEGGRNGAGADAMPMHLAFAQALDGSYERIRAIQAAARARSGASARPRWPAIVLRTPKGWTGPRVVDGTPVEGTFRAHQVPLANVRANADHLSMLDRWMRGYRPDELFERRPAHRGSRAARFSRVRRAGAEAGHRASRVDAPSRAMDARHIQEQEERVPAVLPRRDQLQSPG